MEVYVRPFPSGGSPVRISLGGNHAVWSRDGRELFYRDGRRVMVAALASVAGWLEGRSRRVLFEGDYDLGTATNYDHSPDGRIS